MIFGSRLAYVRMMIDDWKAEHGANPEWIRLASDREYDALGHELTPLMRFGNEYLGQQIEIDGVRILRPDPDIALSLAALAKPGRTNWTDLKAELGL